MVGVLAPLRLAAQTFPSTTTQLPTRSRCLGCIDPGPTAVQQTDLIFLYRPRPAPGGENGLRLDDYGALPLSAFASASELGAFRDQLGEGLGRIDKRLSRGVALSSATDLQRPAAGAANRLGGMITTYGGETATGFSYARQSRGVDLGVAVGLTRGESMGKASVGFSW
jgi:hypothetical protein